ncbi:MAG: hypothetical protein JWR52_2349 [Marmoricola sp.]|nr:hypothetical protein [Marmoricola sp.]
MDLPDFVLARIEEQEESWRVLGQKDEALELAMDKGLQRCAEKRRAVKAYVKKPNRPLREQLQHYALVYYDHPEYDQEWHAGPRWNA